MKTKQEIERRIELIEQQRKKFDIDKYGEFCRLKELNWVLS